MAEIIDFILHTVSAWGYWGIFILMFIESSFIPFPSEVIMVPAGYLAFKGQMHAVIVIGSGVAGSIAGACFNYFLALMLGRPFLYRYGRHFFISRESLVRVEDFFRKHGEYSTFIGRLIPMVRQLISLPAGLARMKLISFVLYTGLGSCIWVAILVALGYVIGHNQELIQQYLRAIIVGILVLVAILTVFYVAFVRRKDKKTPTC